VQTLKRVNTASQGAFCILRQAPPARWLLGVVPGLLLVGSAGHAFTIEQRAVRYADKKYECELTLTLDAPLERVEAVLRDYESYPDLDSRILRARVVERPEEHVAMLETTLRACFGPFCRHVTRIERVEEKQHSLAAVTDAARSDMKFGETHTALEAIDERSTRVTYKTSLTPDFWIPPFVGPRWMLNTLEDATSKLFMNVEIRAREALPAQASR
jgi:hypothetical protein